MYLTKDYLEYINKQLDDISKLMFHSDCSNKPMYKAAYLLGHLKASIDLTLQDFDEEEKE